MPVSIELLILCWFAYAAGLAIGWAIWGRAGYDLGEQG